MKRYLLVLLLLPGSLMAQQKIIDSIKFELIKATVHFYATDTAFNRTGIGLSQCKSSNYDCLKEFSKTNNLTKVDERITSWSGVKCQTVDDLLKLKERVITDLTDKKEYRKELPGYGDYTKRLFNLMAILPNVVPPILTETPSKGDTIKKAAENSNGTIVPKDGETTGLLTWIALFAGLGGLGLSGWVYTRNPTMNTHSNNLTNVDIADKLEGKIATLNTQLLLKADASTVPALQQRIDELEKELRQLTQKAQETIAPSTLAAKVADVVSKAIVYAKLPDLPNGFSNSILKKEQNGEQVYEIVINDNTATYSISENSPAQTYAMNDVSYILDGGCTLLNQPFNNCRIHTKEKGILTKTGEGWMVDRKAVVEFV